MIHKNLLVCALTGAITLVGANASATLLPFTINEQSISSAFSASFDADRISGNYKEVLTVKDNTFAVSLLWRGTSFTYDNSPISRSSLNNSTGYGLYALFQASGTVAQSDAQKLNFTFTEGGNFTLFVDPTNTNDFTSGIPSFGSDAWKVIGSSTPIAQGNTISGSGDVDTPCKSTFSCGKFNADSTLALISPAGTSYFTAPSPFYNIALDAGDIKEFKQQPTQTLYGDMSITFTNAVPEPTSVALLGLGLLGIAASRRKSANSKNA